MSDATGPLVAFIAIGAAVIVVVRLVGVLNGASGSSEASSDDVASAMAGAKPARAKHYVFGHQFLRKVTVTTPAVWEGVRAAAQTGAINGILERMWSEVDEAPEEDSGRAPRGEAIEGGVLIRMSAPEGMTECYWVAILEHGDRPRYFTLEKSLTNAVLCEWTDDAHVNLGPCEIDEATFVAAARSKVAPPSSIN